MRIRGNRKMTEYISWNPIGISGRIAILTGLLFVLVIQPSNMAKSQSPVSDSELELMAQVYHYKKLAMDSVRAERLRYNQRKQ